MVIVESRLSARAFGRSLEMPLLMEVGRVLVGALCVYGAAASTTSCTAACSAGVRRLAGSVFFQLEFGLGSCCLPLLLLVPGRARATARRSTRAGLLVVMGFVVNRLNVSLTGLEAAQGGHYVPAWSPSW